MIDINLYEAPKVKIISIEPDEKLMSEFDNPDIGLMSGENTGED